MLDSMVVRVAVGVPRVRVVRAGIIAVRMAMPAIRVNRRSHYHRGSIRIRPRIVISRWRVIDRCRSGRWRVCRSRVAHSESKTGHPNPETPSHTPRS